MKIEFFFSRNNRQVANQYKIIDGTTSYFQSYNRIICKKETNQLIDGAKTVTLDTMWDWSRTTLKYLEEFLGIGINMIRYNIAQGNYNVTNLNI